MIATVVAAVLISPQGAKTTNEVRVADLISFGWRNRGF
jgi:hypothetical protein